MDIIQTFYDNMASQYDKLFMDWNDNMASQYDKLFMDWNATTQEQAVLLNRIFNNYGFNTNAHILDCACGIGTQAIGLASLGYPVTASDISDGELVEAKARAKSQGVSIRFEHADFCALADTFSEQFDIVIAMDNALPHMLTAAHAYKRILESGCREHHRAGQNRRSLCGQYPRLRQPSG